MSMASPDFIVSAGGIAYGIVLVAVAFTRHRFAETLRIDALMVPRPSETTRLLNPVIGLALIGYQAWLLVK
jgi:hypothetical protein